MDSKAKISPDCKLLGTTTFNLQCSHCDSRDTNVGLTMHRNVHEEEDYAEVDLICHNCGHIEGIA